LKHILAHVRWLGGSVCAGKTSISQVLATRFGLEVYHCDRLEREHLARAQPGRQPAMTSGAALSMDECWVFRSPEVMAESSFTFHQERFEMIVDDLLGRPGTRPVLVEGFGLLPACVMQVIREPHQALWLVTTPAFLTAMRYQRGMTAPGLTSDPERARRNLIARDILMTNALTRELTARGLPLIEVAGSQPLDTIAGLVARRLQLTAQLA
jgi:hypothetical protein